MLFHLSCIGAEILQSYKWTGADNIGIRLNLDLHHAPCLLNQVVKLLKAVALFLLQTSHLKSPSPLCLMGHPSTHSRYKRKQVGTFVGFKRKKEKEEKRVYSYLPSKFVDHLNWDT